MDRHVPLFGFCVRRKRGCKFASEKFPHRTRGDNDAAVCVWLRLVALLQVTESMYVLGSHLEVVEIVPLHLSVDHSQLREWR